MSATPHLYLSIREELESGLFSSRTESRSWVWSHWRRVGCTMLHGSQGLRRPTTHVPTVTQCQTIFMSVAPLSNSFSSSSSSYWVKIDLTKCTSPWLNYVTSFCSGFFCTFLNSFVLLYICTWLMLHFSKFSSSRIFVLLSNFHSVLLNMANLHCLYSSELFSAFSDLYSPISNKSVFERVQDSCTLSKHWVHGLVLVRSQHILEGDEIWGVVRMIKFLNWFHSTVSFCICF